MVKVGWGGVGLRQGKDKVKAGLRKVTARA